MRRLTRLTILAAREAKGAASGTLLVVAALLPIGLLTFSAYHLTARSVRDQVKAHTGSAATIAAEFWRRELEQRVNLARALAALPGMVAAVERRDANGVRTRLMAVVKSYHLIDRAFVTDPTGVLWADYPRAPESLGRNFSDRDWYRGLSEAWTPYVSEVYRRHAEPKRLVIGIAVPVRRETQVLGALVLQYRLVGFTQWLRTVTVRSGGYLVLTDHRGTVVAHPTYNAESGEHHAFADLPPVQSALQGTAQTAELTDPLAGRDVIASFIPIPVHRHHWVVMAAQPTDEAYAPLWELRRQLTLLASLLALAALAAVVGFARSGERVRRLNRQLAEHNERLQHLGAIVESSDDAILSLTPDGIIRTWNAGAERLYGYTAPEVVGKPVSILAPADHHDEVPGILERIKRGERVERFETVRSRENGERIHVSLTVSPIRDSEGNITGASSISRDITRRKKNEAALRELYQELEAFTYSVSHDLRAPLRHVDGFAKILAEEFESHLGEQAQHLLRRIQHGTAQMGTLIDDLLTLSRAGRQRLALRPTSLHALVEEVLTEMKPEWDGRRIEWHVAPLPLVDCDPGLMKQVFFNLLSNAFKFTRPQEHAVVQVGQTADDGETVIFVRDNGIGFDMKYAHKLFGVFQRLHRQEEFEGTGVGLALVQRIIHRHGGRIWAEAEPGKGATFSFTLGVPLRNVSETVAEAGGAPS